MNLGVAEKHARALMRMHGLYGWNFKWDGAKRRYGMCTHNTHTISMSRPLVSQMTELEVENIMLHEIAHALVGPGHGHNEVWRRKALSIGCDGKRCGTSEAAAIPNWRGICPNGHDGITRFRRPAKGRAVSCAVCNPGSFDKRYVVKWVPYKEKVNA